MALLTDASTNCELIFEFILSHRQIRSPCTPDRSSQWRKWSTDCRAAQPTTRSTGFLENTLVVRQNCRMRSVVCTDGRNGFEIW